MAVLFSMRQGGLFLFLVLLPLACIFVKVLDALRRNSSLIIAAAGRNVKEQELSRMGALALRKS
ncbi:MAG: hypothetical protein ACLVJ6_08790 [Merdibacter sp.]